MMKSTFFDDLIKEIKKENFIIVEGKKDFLALNQLGFKKSKIIILNSGNSLFELIEKINTILEKNKLNKITILTDNDKKGRILYQKIKNEILYKKQIDNKLKELLIENKISHVEGIYSYIKNIQKKLYRKR